MWLAKSDVDVGRFSGFRHHVPGPTIRLYRIFVERSKERKYGQATSVPGEEYSGLSLHILIYAEVLFTYFVYTHADMTM